jgi:hypothetical protein
MHEQDVGSATLDEYVMGDCTRCEVRDLEVSHVHEGDPMASSVDGLETRSS